MSSPVGNLPSSLMVTNAHYKPAQESDKKFVIHLLDVSFSISIALSLGDFASNPPTLPNWCSYRRCIFVSVELAKFPLLPSIVYVHSIMRFSIGVRRLKTKNDPILNIKLTDHLS